MPASNRDESRCPRARCAPKACRTPSSPTCGTGPASSPTERSGQLRSSSRQASPWKSIRLERRAEHRLSHSGPRILTGADPVLELVRRVFSTTMRSRVGRSPIDPVYSPGCRIRESGEVCQPTCVRHSRQTGADIGRPSDGASVDFAASAKSSCTSRRPHCEQSRTSSSSVFTSAARRRSTPSSRPIARCSRLSSRRSATSRAPCGSRSDSASTGRTFRFDDSSPVPCDASTGEATPGYIYSIAAADRIRDRLPNCKLLVVIRDPTDRAMSNYDNLWRRGQEERPIGEAIRSSLEAARTVTNSDVDACLDISNYVERGLYARFLGPWYERFPPEQILVVSLEELVANTRQTMAEVCEFIGIEPPTTDAPFAKRNDSREKHLDPTIVPELDEFYREPNRELADMLRRFQPERPLPPWLGDDHPR
ncbi:MAG: sulfotransferase domain-containing protein [Ilumatobacteraceae bacterium]